MEIRRIVVGAFASNAYLCYRQEQPDAVLIDAGADAEKIERAIGAIGKRLAAIVLTHGHFDHTMATRALCDAHDAPLYIHAADAEWLTDEQKSVYLAAYAGEPFANRAADYLIETPNGTSTLSLAGIDFQVLSTPGHTPGSICLYAPADKVLFTGDTLFAEGYGRLDLPGGDAEAMRASLRMLLHLPEDIVIYPGHGASALKGRVKGGFV